MKRTSSLQPAEPRIELPMLTATTRPRDGGDLSGLVLTNAGMNSRSAPRRFLFFHPLGRPRRPVTMAREGGRSSTRNNEREPDGPTARDQHQADRLNRSARSDDQRGRSPAPE